MNLKHGMTGTRTFKSWETMKQRCTNPNAVDYERFGGRGIKVCAAWSKSFLTFLYDMGIRPEGKTLDRIDVNGNYTPKNCKWSTASEQHRNRRNTRYVTYKGKKYALYDLAEKFKIKPAVLMTRLGSGWSIEKALTEPIMEGRGRKRPRKD